MRPAEESLNKLKEGIAERLYYRIRLPSMNTKWEELTPSAKERWFHLADNEMEWLQSKGVVIMGENYKFG